MWEIFEKLCAEMGVTPYKVAKDTGITQSTIYNWKTRNNLIGVERGQKIADYFGVSLDMGHEVGDITKGRYTHITADELTAEMKKYKIE